MTLMTYLLTAGLSILGEDDGKILTTSSIISVHTSYHLKRSQWGLFNRLRSGHGRYASFMHSIGLRENANCICGAIQTPQHVLNCRMIGTRGDLRTVNADFHNCICSNKLSEL